MSKSKIALIAALAGMSIASPAFAQTRIHRKRAAIPLRTDGRKYGVLGTRKIPQVIGAEKSTSALATWCRCPVYGGRFH